MQKKEIQPKNGNGGNGTSFPKKRPSHAVDLESLKDRILAKTINGKWGDEKTFRILVSDISNYLKKGGGKLSVPLDRMDLDLVTLLSNTFGIVPDADHSCIDIFPKQAEKNSA